LLSEGRREPINCTDKNVAPLKEGDTFLLLLLLPLIKSFPAYIISYYIVVITMPVYISPFLMRLYDCGMHLARQHCKEITTQKLSEPGITIRDNMENL
jgi:hypothetical protein